MWKRRRKFEDGMSEEMRFHMEQFADDLVQRGVAPEEAARLARIEFGSLQNVKSECREARGLAIAGRADAGVTLRRSIAAEDAGFHRHRSSDSGHLPGSEPYDFRGDGFDPAAPASVSRGQSAGHDVQQLSESRRGSRWFLHHQLLRTARADSGVRIALAVSIWQRDCRRSRFHGTRAYHSSFSGIFHHARSGSPVTDAPSPKRRPLIKPTTSRF